MASKELIATVAGYEKYIETHEVDTNVLEAFLMATQAAFADENIDLDFSLELSKKTKGLIDGFVKKKTGGDIFALERYCNENHVSSDFVDWYYECLKYEAQNVILDSYFLYLEKNREYKERFYLPKRKQFAKIGVIDALQDMLEDKLDILTISMPPGVGKTSISKFFVSGVVGWFPEKFSLFFSHSDDITKMYYEGALDIVQSDEYTWHEIFPHLQVTKTDAKREQFNVGKYKPFPSLQCTSRGSSNAGKVRANAFLLVDDLIAKLEEALNKSFLDKLWDVYAVDARQRKMDGCKEIHIATRWSVHDVIGRLSRIYQGDKRCRFISVPDIDEESKKSNFDFEFNGFSVEFFNEQEKIMDDISYRCLFKNQPVEREGLLYHEDELRRYTELPDREPDAIIGICDTKDKGSDFMVLPVMYQYGDDYYMVDCICDDSTDYNRQQTRLSRIILDHNMQQCEFESNAGGGRLAHEVSDIVKGKGGRCNITTKATETNKETRIIVNSDWVKKHVLFKMKEDYAPKSDYGIFMSWLLSYSVVGKNTHDDVVDALANFCLYVTRGARVATVQAVQNPFRMGGSFW